MKTLGKSSSRLTNGSSKVHETSQETELPSALILHNVTNASLKIVSNKIEVI